MAARNPLTIRLLGELQLAYGDGPALVLPASRKTRALVGFLVATGQPHRREKLCDLFWDGPDDPRAELRWCLSKIRPLLNRGGARLVADRQRVAIELGNDMVDLASVRALLRDGVAAASTEALKQSASLFSGEFLDGLELPVCYRYQEWCMAERETVSRSRLAVLAALIERLHDSPADALPYAHTLAAADPLSETGHAAVVRLLARAGRSREALSHYERVRRMFEAELGVPPSEELEEARLALQSIVETRAAVESSNPGPASPLKPARSPSRDARFIGREAEQALIERIITTTIKRQASDILLVTGEAGIGKSRLLGGIADQIISAGGSAWMGRGFEVEAVRPYGIWFDILRPMAHGRTREELPRDLGMLFPDIGAVADTGDQPRLFDAVLDLLRQVAKDRASVVVLDDIQWIDEASSSLLHYIARRLDAGSGILIVCAARSGEIEDNAAASSALRSLGREGRLHEIELGPLSPDETKELVRLVDPTLDGGRIFAQSDGNPLFALELARAHGRGEHEPGPTIERVIASQLAGVTEQAREVLLWAAAYGRAFTPDDIARGARLAPDQLVMALGELERHGLMRPISDDAYDFTHDLVRQTAYRSVSQPRRRVIHQHIARVLAGASISDTAIAADLVYHAGLAGDRETAARACIVAGERALRLFANVEAVSFAERGLSYAARMTDGAARLEMQIALLKLRILAAAGPGMRPLPPLIETVTQAAAAAEALGLQAAAATAHYLLSVLHQEAGDTRRAETSTLRAAAAGRSADETTRANQLANTARCLLELETGISRSRKLIGEAGTIVAQLGLELCELHWAWGLLHRWDGDAGKALTSLARALALAHKDEDRWREYKCLTWLAMLDQESGRYDDMHARCEDLTRVARRLGEDETPFVATLQALALLATDETSAGEALADALRRLRTVDDKSYLAYALNSAARLYLQSGCLDQVRLYAAEALDAATAMRRENEITIARGMLAQAGENRRDPDVESVLAARDMDNFSARARSTLLESADQRARFQREFPR